MTPEASRGDKNKSRTETSESCGGQAIPCRWRRDECAFRPGWSLCSCEGRSPDRRSRIFFNRQRGAARDWIPAFAGIQAVPGTLPANPGRTVRLLPARRQLGGFPARPAGPRPPFAVGAGADGDPGGRASVSAGICFCRPHPCRGARFQGRAVGHGGGLKMRRDRRRDRRAVGRPGSAGFYRDAAAGGGGRAAWRGGVASAAWRLRELERCAAALAGGKRAELAPSAQPACAGDGGVGCRIVSRARRGPGALDGDS